MNTEKVLSFDEYRKLFPAKFVSALKKRFPPDGKSKREFSLNKFLDAYAKLEVSKEETDPSVSQEKIAESIKSKKADLRPRVSAWKDSGRDTAPEIKSLLDICCVLDCDPDYFLTNTSTLNKSDRQYSTNLGLRLETVEKIKAYDSDDKELLDIMTSSNPDALNSLLVFILYYSLTITGIKNPPSQFHGVNEMDVLEYRTQKNIAAVLAQIRQAYAPLRDSYIHSELELLRYENQKLHNEKQK